MDKIDVFGYKWIDGFEPIIESCLIAELKRETVSGDDISQIMKYVDWVRSEYAGGDYSMLKAFLVGNEADVVSLQKAIDQAERRYVVGARPSISCRWDDLTVVTYHVEESGYIKFAVINLPC